MMGREIQERWKGRFCGSWLIGIAVALMLLMGVCDSVVAFSIPTGNEDLRISWDNALKYNYAVRVKSPSDGVLNNRNLDDGDRNFNKGTIQNRLDLRTELDVVYQRLYGFHASAAFWYDQRYHDPLGNDSVATSNHLENNVQSLGVSKYAMSHYGGPSGELLDCFAFGQFDLGPAALTVRAGRHTIYWGEALFTATQSIAYAQFPLDSGKALSVPGTEAKELFRPLNNISAALQLGSSFSFEGQYFLEWDRWALTESGTYFSSSDVGFGGAEALLYAPGAYLRKGDDVEPDDRDWGIMGAWTPEFLGTGRIALYYRHFSNKIGQTHMDFATGQYFFVYPDKIDLYGVSFSKTIFGSYSLGSELSYRTDMPLSCETSIVAGNRPTESGDTLGTRGNTLHGVVNVMGGIMKTPLFDSLTWIVEGNWSHWTHVTQNAKDFYGRDSKTDIDHVTEHAFGCNVSITPLWVNVIPGWDLKMPLSWGHNISGVYATGGNEGSGSWKAGFNLDINHEHQFDLNYVAYYGDVETDPITGGIIHGDREVNACFADRDMITFTYKTNF
ncbi:MAG: DUF1302 family protein [Syntrophales bacterium]|nr:DUF1302 family protein [Syntrophales bacterium]